MSAESQAGKSKEVRTWKQLVVGENGDKRMVLDDEFLTGKVALSYPDREDGDPVFEISGEVLKALADAWSTSLIVKTLGALVPHVVIMEKKLRELWKPDGKMMVAHLPNGYYVVKFDVEGDYCKALMGGPWMLFGHYLIVRQWSAEFNPFTDVITTTPTWIRISGLPMVYYEETILWRRGLGCQLKWINAPCFQTDAVSLGFVSRLILPSN